MALKLKEKEILRTLVAKELESLQYSKGEFYERNYVEKYGAELLKILLKLIK